MRQEEKSHSLTEIFENTVKSAPQDHPDKTSDCLAIPRFEKAVRENWSTAERSHVADCRYCRKLLIFEWELYPPSLWRIALFLAGMSNDPQAMQVYFDRNPFASELRDSVFVHKLASSIQAVKGMAASLKELPEFAKSDWFGFGLLTDSRLRGAIGSSGVAVDEKLAKMERWSNAIAIGRVENIEATQLSVTVPDGTLTVSVTPKPSELTIRAVSAGTGSIGRRVAVELLLEEAEPIRVEIQVEEHDAQAAASGEIKLLLPDAQRLVAHSSLLASWI